MGGFSRRRSMAQERRAAADVGGRVQVASGATPFAKSDVRKVGELRVECKTTSKRVYSLKLADLLKLRKEAISQGLEMWVFQIEFQGSAGLHTKLAVVDAVWFEQLGGYIEENDRGAVSAKSFQLSRAGSGRPLLFHWTWVKPGSTVTQHFSIVVCTWEHFMSLWKEGKT